MSRASVAPSAPAANSSARALRPTVPPSSWHGHTPSRAEDSQRLHFLFSCTRTKGEPIGIATVATPECNLRVAFLREVGAIPKQNVRNSYRDPPGPKICPMDVILSVNGEFGPKAMRIAMSNQHRLHLHVCRQLDLEVDAVDACAQHSDPSVLRKRSYELVGGDRADGMRHPTELQRLSDSELGAIYGIGYTLLKRWCKDYTGGGLRNDSLTTPIGMHTQPHHTACLRVPFEKLTDDVWVPAGGPSSSVTTSPAPPQPKVRAPPLDVAALALTAKVPNLRNKRTMVPGTAVVRFRATAR